MPVRELSLLAASLFRERHKSKIMYLATVYLFPPIQLLILFHRPLMHVVMNLKLNTTRFKTI